MQKANEESAEIRSEIAESLQMCWKQARIDHVDLLNNRASTKGEDRSVMTRMQEQVRICRQTAESEADLNCSEREKWKSQAAATESSLQRI